MNKNTLIILGVIILLGAVYFFYSSSFGLRTAPPEGNFSVGALNVADALEPAWEGFKEGMADLG